ncbi:hypothetical protein BD560DRAFT_387488 [Blakeslea trispora]|nr:hypothetical protein BD560DRAFT_387488 [Blakeslea trispora]
MILHFVFLATTTELDAAPNRIYKVRDAKTLIFCTLRTLGARDIGIIASRVKKINLLRYVLKDV